MDLLRVSTAGSVDDGKSTLIGRLLYDSKGLLEDQIEAARRATRNVTAGEIDLSLLTDGLRAEREQGITIDVAYRYFATPRRKFILADTPGHEQYTRNMATGASTAELAIILIDARKGVLDQSRRHTAIATLLGIRHLVVTVNKMDLVDWSPDVFDGIRRDFRAAAARLTDVEPVFIPVSALLGDNVVSSSSRMPWYEGPSLLETLETAPVHDRAGEKPFRMPVQLVLRPDHAFRGFAGRIATGRVKVGDPIQVLPSGRRSRVRRIHTFDRDLAEAEAPRSVALLLEDEIDISRGDLIVRVGEGPRLTRVFEASVVWMDDHPLVAGRPWFLRQGTRTVRATVTHIVYRRDVVTLDAVATDALRLNDIGRVRIEASLPVFLDPYERFRETGCFILVDPESNATSGAGMISFDQPAESRSSGHLSSRVDRSARGARNGHRGTVVWLTGLPGSGKSTLAKAAESRLFLRGLQVYALDSDQLQDGLCTDLGLSEADRAERVRRAAEVARILADSGLVVLAAVSLPLRADRELARRLVGDAGFLEVHASAPLDACAARDPKGLYARARAGQFRGLAGVDGPYEEPLDADLALPTHELGVEDCVERLLAELVRRGVLRDPGTFLAGEGI
jgi:bifunctional enzyme CysN/CysC